METYTIVLIRNTTGFFSNNSLSTDAHNAIASIPGTEDVRIIKESEEEVEVSYTWNGPEKIWNTDEYLSKHGVCRK